MKVRALVVSMALHLSYNEFRFANFFAVDFKAVLLSSFIFLSSLNLRMFLYKFQLYTPNTCEDGKPKSLSQENPFCEENVDVSNYLNLNSRKNHSDFCLAYAFTFRDFVGGTLGLAWVASPNHSKSHQT